MIGEVSIHWQSVSYRILLPPLHILQWGILRVSVVVLGSCQDTSREDEKDEDRGDHLSIQSSVFVSVR